MINKEEVEKLMWEAWRNNFHNAKSFFTSKGNFNTREKLKIKWYNSFFEEINKSLNKVLK